MSTREGVSPHLDQTFSKKAIYYTQLIGGEAAVIGIAILTMGCREAGIEMLHLVTRLTATEKK